MNRSLRVDFKVVFGNVYMFIVIFNVRGGKMRISASSQTSLSESSIFGHFEVIFLNV